jgi:hypothetical protein
MSKKSVSDSHLELDVQPRQSQPGGNPHQRSARATKVPVLSIDSRTPLPALPPTAENAPNTRDFVSSTTPDQPLTASASGFWFDGNVVMCACPDCQAPMTVRLWLMIADCWRCQTSIELSEQEEQEVRRLLRQRAQQQASEIPATGAVRAATVPSARSEPRPPTASRPVSHRRVSMPPTPRRSPAGVAPATRDYRRLRRDRDVVGWLHALLQSMPAWLISFVLHVILLTLLGLLTQGDSDGPYIRLSAKIARNVTDGGDTRIVPPDENSEFDLGIPEEMSLDDPAERRALVRADQEARELRLLDPNNPHVPDLDQVKQTVRSSVTSSRMLLGRDPRLRVELVQQEGGTTLTEAAVARGLLWLKRHQNSDGSWSLDRFRHAGSCRCGGRGSLNSNHAGTALALLPFLGAGQTHLSGIYRDEVSRGLRWLVKHQKPDGDLRGNTSQYPGMYAQGQAAIVLCEAFLMTGDEQLRIPAQRAIDFIVEAQYLDGGWRYFPRQRAPQIQGDTSVLGWQLMALQSALAANLSVPEATLENASHFLDGVEFDDGSQYAYIRRDRPSPAMSAEGLLCRVYLGWKRNHPALREGIDRLVTREPPRIQNPNIYYWYYATQVVHHYGGAPWNEWNLHMRDVLVGCQETRGHEAGSWDPQGPLTQKGGRIYMTSLAICCLEVYYRHLPLFRQIELD